MIIKVGAGTAKKPNLGILPHQLILVLTPDGADEIVSQLAACSDDYESLPEYSKKFYDKLKEFAG